MKNSTWSNICLFIGALQFFLGMVIAEALYPGFSPSNNYISDLGMIGSPVATLFNTSAILFGILTVAGAYGFSKKDKLISAMLLISGLGFLGVAIFPGDNALAHLIVAVIGLASGGLTILFSYRLKNLVLKHVSIPLGLLSLIALVLLLADKTMSIGIGGMERLALYPFIIWFCVLATNK